MREEGVVGEEESCVERLLPQGPVGEWGWVRLAVEEVGGGVWMGVAVGADVRAGFSDAVEVGEEQLATATTQLKQGAPPIAR